jgi:hypothetical protein
MSSSRYLLDLAARNFGWDVSGSVAVARYGRPGTEIEVYFNDVGGNVRAAYLVASPRFGIDRIKGGVPAITAELKRFGG